MALTELQRKRLEELSRPLIEWLNNNCHPHCEIHIDCESATLTEDVCRRVVRDYIKD